MTTTKGKTIRDERDWSSLPPEVLGLIESKFSTTELIHDVNIFRAVCKRWGQAYHPKDKISSQWLVQKRDDESNLKLFHPLSNMCNIYCINFSDLCHTSILYSIDEWLLMFCDYDDKDMFFFNPFVKSKIQLPTLPPYDGEFYGFTCTSNPISDDCVVFGIAAQSYKYIDVLTICKGASSWTITRCMHDAFGPCLANPVYYKGKFYVLALSLLLGVFDPNSRTWIVLEPESCNKYRGTTYDDGYLLDCQGDLTAVFTAGEKPLVLRWDDCGLDSDWQEVNELGEYMFYLSNKASFSRKSELEFMKNKIYFPMECKDYGIFYSMDNGLYQTLGNDFSTEFLYEKPISGIMFSCWIEPSQHQYKNIKLQWIHGEPDVSIHDFSEGKTTL